MNFTNEPADKLSGYINCVLSRWHMKVGDFIMDILYSLVWFQTLIMVWISTFPYKCQVAAIIIGLSAVSCGIIFWLIAMGMTSPMWQIMAISSLIFGATCTLTGSIWCCCAVHRTGSDVYGQFKEGEAETQISEATEMIRWQFPQGIKCFMAVWI